VVCEVGSGDWRVCEPHVCGREGGNTFVTYIIVAMTDGSVRSRGSRVIQLR